MDVIGTLGAVVGIIDVATRAISTLADIRRRFKEVNFTVELLSTQLVSIRTALDQIQHLIEETLQDDQHYQLVINMGVAINGCNLLIRVLDNQISKLEYDEDEKITIESRVKMVLESEGTEECLTRLDRQISALNLIITAYNARNPVHQKELMENKKSQKVFKQVKDDSSSLYVLCDSASFVTKRTKTTTATSKLSMNFAFDEELLQHRAYKITFRSLLRRAAARQSRDDGDSNRPMSTKPPKPSQADIEQANRSTAIDHELKEDSRRLWREIRILTIGEDAPTLVKAMKIFSDNGYTQEERMLYRLPINQYLLSTILSTMDMAAAAEGGSTVSIEFERHKEILDSIPNDTGLIDGFDLEVGKTLCWCAKYSTTHHELDHTESYFLNRTEQILQPSYIPTEADLIRLPTRGSGVYETRINMDKLSMHVFHMNSQRGERRKWIHAFENINFIIFTTDLASYDQILLEDANQNRMMESLALFDSVVNSRWFKQIDVILLLHNIAEFKAKLGRSPLQNYFPDYTGGNDDNRAAKYLLWRFNQVNRAHLNLYPHLVEFTDMTNISKVSAAIKDAALQRLLKDSILV